MLSLKKWRRQTMYKGKKKDQCPPGLGSFAYKGKSVDTKKVPVNQVDDGVGPKKKTTKND
jgi:hypothetical protein